MVRIKSKFTSLVSCCSRHNESLFSNNAIRTTTDFVSKRPSTKPTKTSQDYLDELSNVTHRGSSPIEDLDDLDAAEVSWFPHNSVDSEPVGLSQRRYRGGGVKGRIGITSSTNSISSAFSSNVSDVMEANSNAIRNKSKRNVKDDGLAVARDTMMGSNWCTSTPATDHRSINREGYYGGNEVSVLADCGSWTTDYGSDDTMSSSNISDASNITFIPDHQMNSSLNLTILGRDDATTRKSLQSMNTRSVETRTTDIHSESQFRNHNTSQSQVRKDNTILNQFGDNNTSRSQFRDDITSERQFGAANTSRSQFRGDITNESQFTDNNPSSISIYTESIGFDLTIHSPQHLGVSFHDQRTPGGLDEEAGVYVSAIRRGSLAHLDGRLSVGDIVLEINGIDIESMSNAEAIATIREQLSRRGLLRMLIGRYYVDTQSVLEAAAVNRVIPTDGHNGVRQHRQMSSTEIFVGVELIDWIQAQIITLRDRSDAIAYVQNLHASGHICAIDANGYAIESAEFSQLGWFTFANGFWNSDVGIAVSNWSTFGVNACDEMRLLAIC